MLLFSFLLFVYLGTKLGVTGGQGEYFNGQESWTLYLWPPRLHGATQEPSLSLNLVYFSVPPGRTGKSGWVKCRVQDSRFCFPWRDSFPTTSSSSTKWGARTRKSAVLLRMKGKPWSEHILFRRLVFPIHQSLPLGISGLMVSWRRMGCFSLRSVWRKHRGWVVIFRHFQSRPWVGLPRNQLGPESLTHNLCPSPHSDTISPILCPTVLGWSFIGSAYLWTWVTVALLSARKSLWGYSSRNSDLESFLPQKQWLWSRLGTVTKPISLASWHWSRNPGAPEEKCIIVIML